MQKYNDPYYRSNSSRPKPSSSKKIFRRALLLGFSLSMLGASFYALAKSQEYSENTTEGLGERQLSGLVKSQHLPENTTNDQTLHQEQDFTQKYFDYLLTIEKQNWEEQNWKYQESLASLEKSPPQDPRKTQEAGLQTSLSKLRKELLLADSERDDWQKKYYQLLNQLKTLEQEKATLETKLGILLESKENQASSSADSHTPELLEVSKTTLENLASDSVGQPEKFTEHELEAISKAYSSYLKAPDDSQTKRDFEFCFASCSEQTIEEWFKQESLHLNDEVLFSLLKIRPFKGGETFLHSRLRKLFVLEPFDHRPNTRISENQKELSLLALEALASYHSEQTNKLRLEIIKYEKLDAVIRALALHQFTMEGNTEAENFLATIIPALSPGQDKRLLFLLSAYSSFLSESYILKLCEAFLQDPNSNEEELEILFKIIQERAQNSASFQSELKASLTAPEFSDKKIKDMLNKRYSKVLELLQS